MGQRKAVCSCSEVNGNGNVKPEQLFLDFKEHVITDNLAAIDLDYSSSTVVLSRLFL